MRTWYAGCAGEHRAAALVATTALLCLCAFGGGGGGGAPLQPGVRSHMAVACSSCEYACGFIFEWTAAKNNAIVVTA